MTSDACKATRVLGGAWCHYCDKAIDASAPNAFKSGNPGGLVEVDDPDRPDAEGATARWVPRVWVHADCRRIAIKTALGVPLYKALYDWRVQALK